MTYYNIQDVKANGQEIKTIKGSSPCAYCETVIRQVERCVGCKNYDRFEGHEAILFKRQQTLL